MSKSKSSAAVALGKRRAATLTPADRSANAITGWRRRLGTDHITSDQWRVLAHLRDYTQDSVPIGNGVSSDRFVEAIATLNDRGIIALVKDSPSDIEYKRGPAWDAKKHIRSASSKST
jgi:hypothetical protein